MNNPQLLSQAPGSSTGEHWRQRLLNLVLQIACVSGLIALAFYFFLPTAFLDKALAGGAAALLMLITLLTRLSYRVRAGGLLLFLYVAGLGSLLNDGIVEASILFLSFVVMTGLLFASRAGTVSAIALTLLGIVVFGWPGVPTLDAIRLTSILLVASAVAGIALHRLQVEVMAREHGTRQAIEAIEEERAALEQKMEEKAAALARKTEHLRATSYIARKTAEVQDISSLLDTIVALVTDQFGFYHTGIFILNENRSQVVLQAASSEGGQRMVARGHSLAVGTQGIVGYVAAQKKPRIALDVGADAVFFNNPDLPLTRSEVALPLLIRDRILGVLDIQSDRPQAFSMEEIDVFQTLADQIAIAIENARLLDETQAAIVQLEALTSLRTQEAWSRKLQQRGRAFTYTPLGLRAEKLPQNTENVITAPIVLRGQRIGNISIARKGEAKWSRLDQSLLDEVASQVGLAIDNIRLLEEATQRAKQEQTVGRLAAQFSQSLDLDTLLQTAARQLGQLPDVSEVSVLIGAPGDENPRANP